MTTEYIHNKPMSSPSPNPSAIGLLILISSDGNYKIPLAASTVEILNRIDPDGQGKGKAESLEYLIDLGGLAHKAEVEKEDCEVGK